MNIRFGLSLLMFLSTFELYGMGGRLGSSNSQHLKIDLGDHLSVMDDNTECCLQFSSDNKSIALWYEDELGGRTNKILTFSTSGKLLSVTTNSADDPVSIDLEKRFPGIGAKIRSVSLSAINTPIVGFDQSISHCVRVTEGSKKTLTGVSRKVDLIAFEPKQATLWSSEIPHIHADVATAGFFETGGEAFVVVAFTGYKAWVLRQKNGEKAWDFEYGNRETDAEMAAYRDKHGLKNVAIGDPLLKFSAACVSFDLTRHIVACGAFYGRRIRIVSIDAPHAVLRELHSDESPLQDGGIWRVQRVDFIGGRFLIAEHFLGGGAFSKEKRIHEVYDLDTWKCIWQSQDKNTRCLTVSADGKAIAYIRNNSLFIVRGPEQ